MLSFFVARYGEQRKIGFNNSLLISLIFSPLIGFLFVYFLSERKDKDDNDNGTSATEFDIEQFRKN